MLGLLLSYTCIHFKETNVECSIKGTEINVATELDS